MTSTIRKTSWSCGKTIVCEFQILVSLCIFFCCNHHYSLRKIGSEAATIQNIQKCSHKKGKCYSTFFKNYWTKKSPDMYRYLRFSFFWESRKNLITICLPWGCEKLPVETKRATVKSHLSSIIMAAWNWVLEPFQNIVLQKKVPYQNTGMWNMGLLVLNGS